MAAQDAAPKAATEAPEAASKSSAAVTAAPEAEEAEAQPKSGWSFRFSCRRHSRSALQSSDF